ncbi:hypothetical protein ACFV3R_11540 [Streptomyces sp. NPDC059740]
MAYDPERGPRLPEAVCAAVGNYCDLTVDREAVQAGDLAGLSVPLA